MSASPTDTTMQRSEIAALLARGILRMDWRTRRLSAAPSIEKVSVHGEISLDECHESRPSVPAAVHAAETTMREGGTQ